MIIYVLITIRPATPGFISSWLSKFYFIQIYLLRGLTYSYENITKPPQQLIDDYNWFLPETATKR